MWQFLLVAAVAGSTGFFAKHICTAAKAGHSSAVRKRNKKCDRKQREQVLSVSDQTGKFEELESSADSVAPIVSSPTAFAAKEEGIFRFSSPESGSGTGSRPGSKNLRRQAGIRSGKAAVGSEQKLGFCSGPAKVGIEQRKGPRRFYLCLKRRRTGKNLAAKCGSYNSSSKGGSSFFGWGLGVGMMYMLSAGKSEISKLSTAMEETAKVIQELKNELDRRKSSSSLPIVCSASEVKTNTNKCSSENTPPGPNKLSTENREPNDIKVSSVPATDDGGCPSSVLTEEQDPELLEMDQLEAEFVSELQKLPWCTYPHDGMRQNLPEFDPVNDAENETEHQISDLYQFQGVKPSELDQKLSHLLIKQQEDQIVELESELQAAQSKLNEKEAELRSLKDCVRRLTELSLSTVTDDETEAHEEVGTTGNWDYNNMMGSESKKSVVGKKRSLDSELCGY